ncbi:MAG: UbiA family prenyltransferase [Candidatus Aenigmarchaeota archaeon]|nr:UbiA family prenyltransferase [Candidatus Aenigmarchaeota archaeon]
MKKVLEFLVHSNIYLALCMSSVAFMCMTLYQVNFRWEPIFILFIGTFFMYNLNRKTDIKEDKINYHERFKFLEKYGNIIFITGGILFLFTLGLALMNGLYTFLITIFLVILTSSYSIFKMKKIFFLKYILVSVVWGTAAFLVGSYFFTINLSVLLVFIFIFLRVLITTIFFDIRDIKGDKLYGISTIPNKYGVNNTKHILYIINTVCGLFLLSIIYLNLLSHLIYLLSLIVFYCYFYISLIGKVNVKVLGEVADGEYIILGILTIIGVFVIGL